MASKIEWTEETWNPVVGCTPVSKGCRHCYAARMAHRLGANPKTPCYEGLTKTAADGRLVFNGEVRCLGDRLEQPFRWKRPRRVFVNSMGDLFHPGVPDDFVAEVFGVMAVAGAMGTFACGKEREIRRGPRHTEIRMWNNVRYGPHIFQMLTKRPDRMAAMLKDRIFRELVAKAAYKRAYNRVDAGHLEHQIDTKKGWWRCYEPGHLWPLPNVWLGTSVENQKAADKRIPPLLQTPAAVRFVSLEPLLTPCELVGSWQDYLSPDSAWFTEAEPDQDGPYRGLDWVIAGGESGPGARPCNVGWIRDTVRQCREAGVACFVKQLGARPYVTEGSRDAHLWTPNGRNGIGYMDDCGQIHLRSRAGSDFTEWPEDLRVREYPESED